MLSEHQELTERESFAHSWKQDIKKYYVFVDFIFKIFEYISIIVLIEVGRVKSKEDKIIVAIEAILVLSLVIFLIFKSIEATLYVTERLKLNIYASITATGIVAMFDILFIKNLLDSIVNLVQKLAP